MHSLWTKCLKTKIKRKILKSLRQKTIDTVQVSINMING